MERRPRGIGPVIPVRKTESGFIIGVSEIPGPAEVPDVFAYTTDAAILNLIANAADMMRITLADKVARYARSPELLDRLNTAKNDMGPGLVKLHANDNVTKVNNLANSLIKTRDSNPLSIREARHRVVYNYVDQILFREGYTDTTEEFYTNILSQLTEDAEQDPPGRLSETLNFRDLIPYMLGEEKKRTPLLSIEKTADNWFRATEKLANAKGPQAVLVLDYHDRTFMLDPGVTEFDLDVKPRFPTENEGGGKVSFVITGSKEKKPDEPDPKTQETQMKITKILHQDWSEPFDIGAHKEEDFHAIPAEETEVVADKYVSMDWARNWIYPSKENKGPSPHRVVIVGDDAVSAFYEAAVSLTYHTYHEVMTGKAPYPEADILVTSLRPYEELFSDDEALPIPLRLHEQMDEMEWKELEKMKHMYGKQVYDYTVHKFLAGDPNRKFTYTIDHPDAMRPLQEITPGTIRHEYIRKELISRFIKRMSPIFAAKQYDTETINRVWNQFLRDAIDSETRKDEFFDPSNTRTPELVYRLFRAYTPHDEKDPEWMYAKSLDGLDVTVETGRSARRKKRPKHLKSELIYIGVSQQYSDEATE